MWRRISFTQEPLNPAQSRISFHFLDQFLGHILAELLLGQVFKSMRFRAGRISTWRTPPVFEQTERMVIKFSSRSISLQTRRCISMGLIPAKINNASAGRYFLLLHSAAFNSLLIWMRVRGIISLSVTFLRSTSFTGLRAHHSRRTANSNNP